MSNFYSKPKNKNRHHSKKLSMMSNSLSQKSLSQKSPSKMSLSKETSMIVDDVSYSDEDDNNFSINIFNNYLSEIIKKPHDVVILNNLEKKYLYLYDTIQRNENKINKIILKNIYNDNFFNKTINKEKNSLLNLIYINLIYSFILNTEFYYNNSSLNLINEYDGLISMCKDILIPFDINKAYDYIGLHISRKIFKNHNANIIEIYFNNLYVLPRHNNTTFIIDDDVIIYIDTVIRFINTYSLYFFSPKYNTLKRRKNINNKTRISSSI
jgi:hypothetical protein